MKFKALLSLSLIVVFTARSYAQLNEGGTPPSYTDKNVAQELNIEDLAKPDMAQIRWEDSLSEKSGQLYKYGRSINTDFSPSNSGLWETLENGDKIWRLKIRAVDALALGVYYDDFYLPAGGKLFLYNEDRTQVLGAYTSKNNPQSRIFANELVQGETITLEYVQPAGVTENPVIHISEIAYCYRSVGWLFKNTKEFGDADNCEVNINCSEGANWQNQKKGVVRISVKTGMYYGWCSGTMINNTSNNCTPYVLTADHCALNGSTHASATDLNAWIFYFDYEASGCSNPSTEPSKWSIPGCTFKAYGGMGGDTGSDFYLAQLNSSIPSNKTVYFNGWDRNNTAASSGVSIHHPSGDIKKISTFTTTLTTTQWNGNGLQSHWLVYWAATTNGHGVTEGGSSGSPLFNSAGRVIGTLTGGSSTCNSPNQPDGYGKFSYHWASNGTTTTTQLKPWLDPTNTNATTLNGCNCGNTAGVTADFAASSTNITPGTSITFTDLSSGSPTSWSWSFPGGSPSSASTQNPGSIRYNTAGTYNVSLTVSKTGATDSETKTGYIVVGTVPTTCDTLSNVGNTENLTMYGFSGGYWGTWTGHNQYGDKEFADKITNTGQKQVKGMFYAPGITHNGSSSSKVTFKVYQGGTLPGSALGTKDVLISSMAAGAWNYVQFNSPVSVNGAFFLGYQVYYVTPADTFSLYCVENRTNSVNTGYSMNSSSVWEPYSQYSLYTSLGVAGVVCPLVGIEDNDVGDEHLLLFPNPSTGLFMIAVTGEKINNASIRVYDLMGALVYSEDNRYIDNSVSRQLDLSQLKSGLYMVNIICGDKKYVRKVSIL